MGEKEVARLVVIAAVVAIIVGSLGYYFLIKKGVVEESHPPPGERTFELPRWENAARWNFNLFSEIENKQYTMIVRFVGESVIGEKVCYQLNYSFDPPIGNLVTSSMAWLEESTLAPIKIQYFQGDNFLTESTIVYTFSENMWPLRVGKEFTLIENRVTEGTAQLYLVKVEAIENVTTAAGTFECLKIIYYRDDVTTRTEWYSPQIGWYVKTDDNQFKRLIELQSY